LRVIFLGTSSAVPTKDRGLTSLAVMFDGEYVLIDAGECTQRRIIEAGLGFGRLKRVFITHLHGDHFLGLFPMIQTLGILRRSSPLEIYSPPGLAALLECLKEHSSFRVDFPLTLVEFNNEKIFEFRKYTVKVFPVNHGDTPTFGIKISEKPKPGKLDVERADQLGVPPVLRGLLKKGIEVKLPDGRVVRPQDVLGPPRKGKVLVYSSDTRPIETVVKEAAGADLLIHDATFTGDLAERAVATGHSTVEEACQVALKAGVKRLALTHFSARYKKEDLARIEEMARRMFPNAFVARDLMIVDL